MEVHLINLDRDSRRLEQFHHLNSHLPEITRPPAIEGRLLDRHKLECDGMIAPGLSWNNAILGNAHSHISLWRKAVASGGPITVAEDDAIFAKNFVPRSHQFLDSLPSDWGFVMWGWNFDAFVWAEIPEGVSLCRMEFNQDEMRRNVEAFRNQAATHTPIRLRHAFGIMAYTVSPLGARLFLDRCLPLRDQLIEFSCWGVVTQNRTIDTTMNSTYPNMKAYACMPPLALSENRHETSNTRLDP
jgi:GR25 family glycosyltransferase involved in LPS biosynthesis